MLPLLELQLSNLLLQFGYSSGSHTKGVGVSKNPKGSLKVWDPMTGI